MYYKQLYLALAGVGVCVLPVLLPLAPKLSAYVQAEQYNTATHLQAETLKTSEELKRLRIAQRAQTSEALYQSGVMPATRTLRITNYRDSVSNPRPDTTLYQQDELVTVYDATGRCIGEISDGVWKWKRQGQYRTICHGVPRIQPTRRTKRR
jgi:hypothetical protein